MFQEFDADGNGVLTPREFGQALSRVGIKLSKEDFDVLVGDLDKNGDGYIEFGEFSSGVIDHHGLEMRTGKTAINALT